MNRNSETWRYDDHLRRSNQPLVNTITRSALLLAVSIAMLVQTTHAQEQFSIVDDAIIVSAGEAWETEDGGAMYLRRDVVLRAPDWRIRADRGNVIGKLEDPELIVADGNPARIFVSREADEEPFEASSRHIEFDPNNDAVELKGEALVEKGRESIRSQTIDYDLDKDTFSAGDDGRVRVVTTPED